ncbi:MAG: hypothetical protein VBE63_19110 [Lamprobacter sp.]|uniref:hypothetical protein n=1 Tax=Lamprobacter sp. TaxID=3100796 RepID=UPI002B25ADF0|nr:hypothetical protein [Lamprobacter sp.]MEA3642027.1 hypothetical protein [Lamprobacter sp.]
MQIEAEVSQEGVLTAKAPDQYRGKSVCIRIEDRDSRASAQRHALSAMLDVIDAADILSRRHQEIVHTLRDFREPR